jgi:hypothetical protein
MVGNHHEEDDREDQEVRLARLEQGIVALIDFMTQLLLMKGNEALLAEIDHVEHKFGHKGLKGEMLGKLGNEKKNSLSFGVPFKVEANIEIHMYDGQTNVEVLDSWFNQLEF